MLVKNLALFSSKRYFWPNKVVDQNFLLGHEVFFLAKNFILQKKKIAKKMQRKQIMAQKTFSKEKVLA